MSKTYEMNPEVKAEWLKKLRSGEFAQGQGFLTQKTDEGDKYCCLGVLCKMAVEHGKAKEQTMDQVNIRLVQYDDERDGNRIFLPWGISKWAGFEGDSSPLVDGPEGWHSLAWYNDNGFTFNETADMIEKAF